LGEEFATVRRAGATVPGATKETDQSKMWHVAAMTGLGLAGLVFLASLHGRVAGTTLVAPWRWAILSLLCLWLGEVGAGARPQQEVVRYAAAVTTICPLMALLGAKRPQNSAWQFVVASLWLVLCLPAAQSAILWSGTAFQLHGAWSWFLLALCLVGVGNYLATRHAPAALLLAAGQWLLLHPHLPLPGETFDRARVAAGLALLTLATLAVAAGWPRGMTARSGLDRVWLDFRDSYGTVWGLRVRERVNATAQLCGWNARLQWHGFDRPEPWPAAEKQEVERVLRRLLRRFVSRPWIDRRIGSLPDKRPGVQP
jgi:hypothetical protein